MGFDAAFHIVVFGAAVALPFFFKKQRPVEPPAFSRRLTSNLLTIAMHV